ncbi:putative NAD-dependent protein-ADP-ribosyltransferase YbiA (DUF1768 family) [Catenuloplanes nepalensis]|uniref:NAD-dependent protein-ADP-ribosyltransferase YbiA (DUF1768 family) n=1 Tax=Catenuloplanes nepalensis TaxID=587533 RepID=A0ABT9MMA0_9ACTN|nr:NADAR family protein [Catenuloplanes nepalensis]MDP9792549.1 putative NAD-dependent protein-ADP-ribosyltransferase YbiA (DUF1768 family) [Catenuloplanes nepalensis]
MPSVTPPPNGDLCDDAASSLPPLVVRSPEDPYGFLCTRGRLPFVLGAIWPTVEHYIWAQRTAAPDMADRIAYASSARQAKVLSTMGDVRSGWREELPDVIRRAVTARLMQHPRMMAMLLDTGSRPLIVSNSHTGDNLIGEHLMRLRADLPAQTEAAIATAVRLTPPHLRNSPWAMFGERAIVWPDVPRGRTLAALASQALAEAIRPHTGARAGEPDGAVTVELPTATVLLRPTTPASGTTAIPDITCAWMPKVTPLRPFSR